MMVNKNTLKKLFLIFAIGLISLNSGGVSVFAASEAATAEEATPVEELTPPTTETITEPETPPTEPQGAVEAATAPEAAPVGGEEEQLPEENTENQITPLTNETPTDNTNSDEQSGTGGTDGSGNVGDTSIDTGGATAAGSIFNTANTTVISPTPGACNACIDSVQASNTDNGTGSDNDITIDNSNNNSTTVDNTANVINTADFDAVTGENTSNNNVGNSSIGTGDANISASMITSVNETGLGLAEFNIVEDHVGDIYLTVPDNFGFGCITCGLGSASASNAGNGSDSDNAIDLNNTSNNTTLIENDADIVNTLDLTGNTGDNETSRNTGGDNTITTGDVNIAANLINLANSTIFGGAVFVVNVFGNLVGDIIFPDTLPQSADTNGSILTNSGNGSDSDNLINFTNTNNSNINLNNDAYVENNLFIDAETGDNQTSRNTGGNNMVDTGSINVNAEVINVVNTNILDYSDEPLWLILVNNMGTWTGQIVGSLTGLNYAGSGFTFTQDPTGELLASNSGNGTGSNNLIDINNQNTEDFTINNDANVVNNLYIDANTGGNKASNNTGGNNSITTGDINVAASVFNFINTNLIGRNIMLGIVNVFGSCTGNAVPPGQEKLSVGGSSESSAQNNSSSSGDNNGGSQGGNNSSESNTQVLGASINEGNSSNNVLASLFKVKKTTTRNTGSSDNESGSGSNGTEFDSIVYAKQDPGFWKNQYLLLLIPLSVGTLSVLLQRRFAGVK